MPELQENVVRLHLDVYMKVNMKCFENYRKLSYIFIDGPYESFDNLTALVCNSSHKCEFTIGKNGLRCPANCVCYYKWRLHIRCQNRINRQIPPIPTPIRSDYKVDLVYSGQQLIQLPNNTLLGYIEISSLDVSINFISSLAMHQLPREMKSLNISYNPITTVDYEAANYLYKYSVVFQTNIAWMPKCDERTLVKLLQKISRIANVFFTQLYGFCPEKCKCCFDSNTDNFVIDCSGQQSVEFVRLGVHNPNKITLLFVNCSIGKLNKDLFRLVETLKITHLDLRKNYLKLLDEEAVDFFDKKHNNTTIELSENPWDCICKPRSFLFFLKNRSPAEYAKTLSRCKITMCPDSCLCCLENLNSSALTVDCRSQQLTRIPLLPDSVTRLNLENNYITQIDLQSQEFLKQTIFSTGLNLSLSGNPWTCICDENNLVDFVKSISQHIQDFGRMECTNLGKNLALVEESEICPSYFIYLVILFVFSMIIITALNAFVYFKQPILMWLYEHEIFMSMAVRLDLERMKKFDAFLCFTHKDEHLIEDYVERLERGQRKFRLCFYLRDWQVGVSIPECIIQSVKDSRRIIILMTKNFLESTWGKLEFRLALHATSKDRCKRLIVIVYPDVENFDDLDSELKAYMVLNSFLKRDSPNFWNKLVYSMPHIS
ncbi:hypothetical protein KR032_004107 [Drosophila birchii]|nr:hypothetical protein KR032_004107 [Drosophila birchii]